MLKTLLKKELQGILTVIFQNTKNNQRRSTGSIVATCVALGLLYAIFCAFFFVLSGMLCMPMVLIGMDWLYFALIGLAAIIMGVFGSVFTTYATLYQAKDNEMLLAMPIPPSKILFARMFAVWIMGFFFEALVFVPCMIMYWITTPPQILSVICPLLVMLFLSLFILTLTCILGWVVALVASKLKRKNIITVILSLAFFAAYYYFYSQAYRIIGAIVDNSKEVGETIKRMLFPIYHMGLASTGNPISLLITAAIVIALFALVYWVLSRSFLKIATSNKGTAKVKYKEKKLTKSSVSGALLRKEFKRFIGSSTYMLNCGLGSVFTIVAAVFILIKSSDINELFNLTPQMADLKVIAAAAVIAFTASMNDITAPSISLEGKNIWILQSMPVSAWQVLKAKMKLHLYISAVPVLIFALCTDIVFIPDIPSAIILPIFSVIFVLFNATMGLAINLKSPNLTWTNETVAVKQSMGILLTLFGGWGVIVLFALLYFLTMFIVTPAIFLLCCTVLIAAVTALLLYWLKNRGTRIFESL
ncbi:MULTISPECIES: hypothetical protein [unclassified Ruminococcus]|uniref:hypothetical protein n=1 Tax=unclassified Ruminococcus TaxID=2608920 RepID=UPI00210BF129|nr:MULTISPECIES: hypothetical protein [unclassified Ruminococcus]MCQ4022149.1 hypothetical protein [Ruminococcus sp. zg-924]MCQ4114469.1 hypothetical protein [Ruminococcus sp. zg-921]